MSSFSARAHLESVVTRRFPTAIGSRQKPATETIATGITQLDSVIGGIGRGTITELCGPVCSGRSTMLLSLLAQVTRRQEACALVDVTDAFDPLSAVAAGIDLQQILWVRCKTKGRAVGETVDRSLKVADLLSQGGGFSLVILDLADIPPQMMQHVPLHCWFRFRQAIENTPTAMLVLGQESYAKTAASLVLRLQPLRAQWKAPLVVFDSTRPLRTIPSHALLLQGIRMEIQIERVRQASDPTMHRFSQLVVPSFEARTEWAASAPTG